MKRNKNSIKSNIGRQCVKKEGAKIKEETNVARLGALKSYSPTNADGMVWWRGERV